MPIDLAVIGMALIIVSWIIQIAVTAKSNNKAMRPSFAGLQLIGIVLLVMNAFQASGTMDLIAWLNIASAAGALAMLILVLKK